jgi:hypothetical protein
MHILESSHIYDVADQTDRARSDRYYCTVDAAAARVVRELPGVLEVMR